MTTSSPKSLALLIDVDSTTTKAILAGLGDNGSTEVLAVEHAPTTVERPYEDVIIGVRNTIEMVAVAVAEGLPAEMRDAGRTAPELLASRTARLFPFYATSSAGGGLQMLVAGTTQITSAEAAERVSLGAGGVVLASLSPDDSRPSLEKVDLVRELSPDIVLIAGGYEGGEVPQANRRACRHPAKLGAACAAPSSSLCALRPRGSGGAYVRPL